MNSKNRADCKGSFFFCASLLSVAACRPPCDSPFRPPNPNELWLLVSTDPMSRNEAILLVFGFGNYAAVTASFDLFDTTVEGNVCSIEPTVIFDGRRLTMEGASQIEPACSIDLRGTVAECDGPGVHQPHENSFRVSIEGTVIIGGRRLPIGELELFGYEVPEPTPCIEDPPDREITSLNMTDWSLTSTSPIGGSGADGDVAVILTGRGGEVRLADLSPSGGPTDLSCRSTAPEGSILFDGALLMVDLRFSGEGEDCELSFQGRVTDCQMPALEPDQALAGPTFFDDHVYRLEGEGAYRRPDSSGAISTLFLTVLPLFEVPCEIPASLAGTRWSVSNVLPSPGVMSSSDNQLHVIVGADEVIESASFTVFFDGTFDPEIACSADSPALTEAVRFDGAQFTIAAALEGNDGTMCSLNFTGRAIECEAQWGASDRIILLEGEGTFDSATASGAFTTMYLTLPAQADAQ
jgi:hypothetical protein